MKSHVDTLIVGGGMAMRRLVTRLLEYDFDRSIAVVSAEPEVGYNRVLLPSYLSGLAGEDDLFSGGVWRDAPNVEVYAGEPVAEIDLHNHVARCIVKDIEFDRLVFATGSQVNEPPIPGTSLPGVSALRTFADAREITDADDGPLEIVVLGGGLLGLEAADALAQRQHRVRVVQRPSALLNRQLDARGAELLRQALTSRGILIDCNQSVATILGRKRVQTVQFGNGESVSADRVLLATGVRPNDSLARAAGVQCDDGIIVDDQMRSSVSDVYAIGECAATSQGHYSLVEAVHEQADVLASQLSGGTLQFTHPQCGTHLKVHALELFMIGATAQTSLSDVVLEDSHGGLYRRLCMSRGRLTGAVLYGDTTGARQISNHLGQTLDSQTQERLMFGLAA